MYATELIEKLQGLVQTHGDVKVGVWSAEDTVECGVPVQIIDVKLAQHPKGRNYISAPFVFDIVI